MGVCTDFVVANRDELHEAFLTQIPVEMRIVEKHFDSPPVNPFTGEPIEGKEAGPREVREYVPLGKSFAESNPGPKAPAWKRMLGLSPQPGDSFEHLPHAYLKRVDQYVLALLHHEVDGTDVDEAFDKIIQVMMPEKEPQECGVEVLCASFVSGLASLEDMQVDDTANRWSGSQEVQFGADDARQVILELRELARLAIDENKELFFAWSL